MVTMQALGGLQGSCPQCRQYRGILFLSLSLSLYQPANGGACRPPVQGWVQLCPLVERVVGVEVERPLVRRVLAAAAVGLWGATASDRPVFGRPGAPV